MRHHGIMKLLPLIQYVYSDHEGHTTVCWWNITSCQYNRKYIHIPSSFHSTMKEVVKFLHNWAQLCHMMSHCLLRVTKNGMKRNPQINFKTIPSIRLSPLVLPVSDGLTDHSHFVIRNTHSNLHASVWRILINIILKPDVAIKSRQRLCLQDTDHIWCCSDDSMLVPLWPNQQFECHL